jgi:hypothetical protein
MGDEEAMFVATEVDSNQNLVSGFRVRHLWLGKNMGGPSHVIFAMRRR